MFTEAFVKNGAKVFICSRKLKVCQQLADELNGSSAGLGLITKSIKKLIVGGDWWCD